MFPDAVAAIKAHAIAEHPREACGFIVGGRYLPQRNIAPDPEPGRPREFEIAAGAWLEHEVQAVVHSHTNGQPWPSAADIAGQMAAAVPWGLVATDGRTCSAPFYWGDMLEPPPLVGRAFRHGPSGTDGKGDCGALIRDWHRLERGVAIPDFPRDHFWWAAGKDIYRDVYAQAGFARVGYDDKRAGDVFLIQYRSKVPNHGGIYLGGNLILHHLQGSLSRRSPAAIWHKYLSAGIWLRHAP